MWISKKKWNKMCDRINKLEDAHSKKYRKEWSSLLEGYFLMEDGYEHSNKELKVNTNTIPNVTLEELTRLVIDGTPIERKENIEMTSKFYRR